MMLITCTNQGCYSSDHHKLDEDEMKAICNKCLQPIVVSTYALKSMKSLGQVMKKARADFEATCKECGAHDGPVIKRFGKNHSKVICKHCGGINDHLTRHFAEAFRSKPGMEVVDATPEEMKAWGFTDAPKVRRAAVETVKDATHVAETEQAIPPRGPRKVEYYPYNKGSQNLKSSDGVIVVDPLISEDGASTVQKRSVPIPSRQKTSAAPSHQHNRPKTLPPSEERARKKAEVLLTADAKVTFQTPPQQGLTIEDVITTGLSDYAPEGNSD